MGRRKKILFTDYFINLVDTYKLNQVGERTYNKYCLTHRHLKKICPDLYLQDMNANDYQQILNEFGKTHEKATITDFHRQLAWALKRAYNVDGLTDRDVTYDAQIPKGIVTNKKKPKFMELDDMKKLVVTLKYLNSSYANFFLILLKTGLRFAELLGITLEDIDFEKKTISINKTLDYKKGAYDENFSRRFKSTKNKYSVRTIPVDDAVIYMFWRNAKGADKDESIFGSIKGFQYNSSLNNKLEQTCKYAGVPVITLHGLRHEHATYLVSQGIDSRAVAERLGHVDDSVTREVYIHRLETERVRDNQQIMRSVSKI